MEVLTYFLIALVIVLVGLLGVMFHSGIFYRLSIRTSFPRAIPSRVAYKVYKGPYWNAGAGFEDIMHRAPGYTRLFGVYYDDPKKVPSSQLRYIVGCDLTEGPSSRQAEEKLTSEGYSIWTFPKCNRAVITEFPLRSKLCCLVGTLRVYPALNKFFKEHAIDCAGPILEVSEAGLTHYIAPLENNDKFFVSEVTAMEADGKKEQ